MSPCNILKSNVLEKLKVALRFGSSKQGNARRAPVGAKSVVARYGGVLEIAQKAIEGCHCHMMAYAFDFELAQNSNHSVFLIFLLEISITCQNSELAHFFSPKTLS